MKAIRAAVPEVPDKWAVVEELGVLLKNSSRSQSSSVLDLLPLSPSGGDEGVFIKGAQRRSGGSDANVRRRVARGERRQADDAIFIGKGFQPSEPRAGQSRKLLPVWRGSGSRPGGQRLREVAVQIL